MGYDNKYIGRYGHHTPKERSTVLQMSLKIVMYVVSTLLAIALVICYISPYISPTSLGSLTIVAIFSPIVFISVVICALLMVVLKRWIMAGILSLLVLIGLPHLSKFYNIAIMRPAEITTDRNAFTLMSYNVRGFYNDNGSVVVDEFVEYLQDKGVPDILCIQEFASETEGVDRIDSLYQHTFKDYYVSECVEAGSIMLKTYSRFPLIAQSEGNISRLNSGTSAWVDVVVYDDTVRLFNNHLYTMSISESDSEDISRGTIFQDGNRVRSIVNRIDNNSSIRAKHAEILKEVINSSPYSHIVCGDFNDTPMSYVYNTLSDGLNDAFIEHGTGYRSTFRPMRGVLCIDYILYSDGIKGYSYEADKSATLSDHLPIRAQFKVLK